MDEFEAFLAAAADARLEAAWYLLALAGMRIGEVLALRWADVDAETVRIHVRNAVVGVPYAVLAGPRTGPGARTITASPDVLAALRRHRRRQDVERSEWSSDYRDSGIVVCREDGRPLHPRALDRTFRRRLADLGLPAIELAQLRRNHGPWAPRAGVGP